MAIFVELSVTSTRPKNYRCFNRFEGIISYRWWYCWRDDRLVETIVCCLGLGRGSTLCWTNGWNGNQQSNRLHSRRHSAIGKIFSLRRSILKRDYWFTVRSSGIESIFKKSSMLKSIGGCWAVAGSLLVVLISVGASDLSSCSEPGNGNRFVIFSGLIK